LNDPSEFGSLPSPSGICGASEFLDGIIRAQIDRLTPWSANDAVYHWSTPTEGTGGRITMTVVATARAMVTPLAQAVAGWGVWGPPSSRSQP
jgi:general secretion pathway protein L